MAEGPVFSARTVLWFFAERVKDNRENRPYIFNSQIVIDRLSAALRFDETVEMKAGKLPRNGRLPQCKKLFEIGHRFPTFR